MNTPKPRSCGRRLLSGFLGVIVVVALVHGIATFVLGRMVESRIDAIKAKGDPISMSDLAGPPISDSENGGIIYQAILDKLHKQRMAENLERQKSLMSIMGHEVPKSVEELALDTIYVDPANRAIPGIWEAARVYTAPLNELLPQLELAAAKPRCRYKTNWQDGTDALFPHLAELRSMTRTLAVKSALDARNGDMDGAVRSMTAAYRLGDSIKDEPSIIAVLVQCAVRAIESNSLQRVADYGHFDKANARKLYDLYANNEIHAHDLLAMKSERTMNIWVFDAIRKRGGKFVYPPSDDKVAMFFFSRIVGSYAWRPLLYADELQALRMLDEEIELQRQPYREMVTNGLRKRHESSLNNLPSYAKVTRLLFPVSLKVSAKCDEYTARLHGDQIFLALLAYKDSFGGYPATLNELRDKLGWKLLEDPFSGNDFIYKRDGNGFIFYSIGQNLKDDKGLGLKDGKHVPGVEYDDITWRMEH